MRARAAWSSAARVRARLSPLGLRRAEISPAFDMVDKITYLFYKYIMKTTTAGEHSINKVLNPYVDAGELAGAAALVWRDGRLAHVATIGRRDLRAGLPVE